MPRIPIIAALALCLAAPLPALAQDAGGEGNEKVNQLIVYGNDPCPRSTSDDEITVCARKEEGERYRIPAPLRGIDQPESRSWTDRVLAYETVGNTGTLSCSAVGPGGYTGCLQNMIQNAYAEKQQGTDVRFGELISAERARRLSTIDQDAAAEQGRVEDAEREYEARRPATDAATPLVAPLPAGQ